MRRLAGTVLGILLLAGIVAGHRAVPDNDRRMAPIGTSGAIGRPVETDGFSVTVEKVRVARTLVGDDGFGAARPLSTDGIWVVLTARLTGDWKATTYSDTRLETRGGRSFYVSERVDRSYLLTEDFATEPGVPRRGQIAFELPPAELAGAVVRIGRFGAGGGRLAPEAEVDLRIDAGDARRLLRSAPARLALNHVEYA